MVGRRSRPARRPLRRQHRRPARRQDIAVPRWCRRPHGPLVVGHPARPRRTALPHPHPHRQRHLLRLREPAVLRAAADCHARRQRRHNEAPHRGGRRPLPRHTAARGRTGRRPWRDLPAPRRGQGDRRRALAGRRPTRPGGPGIHVGPTVRGDVLADRGRAGRPGVAAPGAARTRGDPARPLPGHRRQARPPGAAARHGRDRATRRKGRRPGPHRDGLPEARRRAHP